MIPEKTPSVIRQGSHTAICLGRKRKFWWLIPMSNKMLRIIERTDQQFKNDRWTLTDYDVARVAQQYLKHGAGISPVAEKHLIELSTQVQQLNLELTT